MSFHLHERFFSPVCNFPCSHNKVLARAEEATILRPRCDLGSGKIRKACLLRLEIFSRKGAEFRHIIGKKMKATKASA